MQQSDDNLNWISCIFHDYLYLSNVVINIYFSLSFEIFTLFMLFQKIFRYSSYNMISGSMLFSFQTTLKTPTKKFSV